MQFHVAAFLEPLHVERLGVVHVMRFNLPRLPAAIAKLWTHEQPQLDSATHDAVRSVFVPVTPFPEFVGLVLSITILKSPHSSVSGHAELALGSTAVLRPPITMELAEGLFHLAVAARLNLRRHAGP